MVLRVLGWVVLAILAVLIAGWTLDALVAMLPGI